jgi:hypothetical protein
LAVIDDKTTDSKAIKILLTTSVTPTPAIKGRSNILFKMRGTCGFGLLLA